MAAALRFPADPALRRQLWRQWVHLDPPRGDKPVTPMRRASATPTRVNIDPFIEATPGVTDGLRSAISDGLVNGQLSFEDRQRFISRGVRLGLSRFDASLLVAAVQHEALERSGVRMVRPWTQKPTKRSRSIVTLVIASIAMEAAIAAATLVYLGA